MEVRCGCGDVKEGRRGGTRARVLVAKVVRKSPSHDFMREALPPGHAGTLLLMGSRFWPGVTLGALAVNLTGGVAPLAAANLRLRTAIAHYIGLARSARPSAVSGSRDPIRSDGAGREVGEVQALM